MKSKPPANFIDLTGQQFKTWIVLRRDEEKIKRTRRGYWICECEECGAVETLCTRSMNSGKTRSCKCVKQKEKQNPDYKQKSRFRKIWNHMFYRCYDPRHVEFFRYGGNGVSVAERWFIFDNFVDDMFDKYVEFETEHGVNSATIDRIDFTGNYEPSNCRWLTLQQQSRNRSDNIIITVRNKEYGTIMELSEDYPEIGYEALRYRYHEGYREEELIMPPYQTLGNRRKNKNHLASV